MADRIPASELVKGKDTRVEGDEKSVGSDQAVEPTPQSLSTTSGSAPSTGASESGSSCAQSDLPVKASMVTPEKSTVPSQKTPPTPEGASKKHDEKKGLGRTIWKATKSLLKISPKKPEKLAIVAVDIGENTTVPSATATSGARSKQPQNRGRLTVDESPDGMETLMTEVASSQDSVFKDDAERKASIASCDTGAHISRLPSLESSSGMDPEEKSPEKEDAEGAAASLLKLGEDERK